MRKGSNRIDALRAKKPKRLPTVLTRDEVHCAFAHLSGVSLLMARLLYGSGLRLMECLRLRVKDLDFDYRTITARDGKGEQDRETLDYVVREMTSPEGGFYSTQDADTEG
jgi:integrase